MMERTELQQWQDRCYGAEAKNDKLEREIGKLTEEISDLTQKIGELRAISNG